MHNFFRDTLYYFADFFRKGGGSTPQIRNPLFAESFVRKGGEGGTPQIRNLFLDQNQVFFEQKHIFLALFKFDLIPGLLSSHTKNSQVQIITFTSVFFRRADAEREAKLKELQHCVFTFKYFNFTFIFFAGRTRRGRQS